MKRANWWANVCLVTGLVVVPAAPLMAQEQEASEPEQPAKESGSAQVLIEEVMVYGTKRGEAESSQDVPIQITAYGAEQIEARQVVTVEDLAFATPNVQLDMAGALPGVQNISIRGMGINGSVPSVDPTVGMFVDGIYLGTIYGAVTDTFDLESVEILRGPQGVLFGRNVTGGAVLLRTKRPSGETGLRAKVGLEEGLQYTFAGSAEGAIQDGAVAGKLSVYYSDNDGTFDNDTLDRDVGKSEDLVIRPTVVFKPTENFDTTVIFEHGESEGDGVVAQFADGTVTGATPLTPIDDVETDIGNAGFEDLTWEQLTIESNYAIWNGTFTNIFGWRDVESDAGVDLDGTSLSLFDGQFITRQDQISDEFRYNGRVRDWWDLTAGLYYFSQDLDYAEGRSIAFGAVQVAGGGSQDHEVLGAFLSNDFFLTDAWILTAGIRYTYEKKEADISFIGSCDYSSFAIDIMGKAGSVSACTNPDFSDDHSWSNWSPKVGLTYKFSDDMLVYAHWTQGYRSGGYNLRANPGAVPGPTDEEKQDSYELGVKSEFLDHRVRLNAALFWNDFSDLQRTIFSNDPALGAGFVVANTADAEIFGVEAEGTFLVTDNFAINAGVGYLDGDYEKLRYDINADGAVDDLDLGLKIPRLSKWTASVGASYDFQLADYGVLSVRGDYSYRSKTYFTDPNTSLLPEFEMVNAGISFSPNNGNWTLTAYGKNLTDEAVFGGNAPLPFGAVAPYFAPLKEGRRFGVEATMEF